MKAIALDPAQKRYLVHIYISQGFTAAKPIAVRYGVSPRTISKYARAIGHEGKRGREPGVWKGVTGRTDNSPRWQKAIERGGVIA